MTKLFNFILLFGFLITGFRCFKFDKNLPITPEDKLLVGYFELSNDANAKQLGFISHTHNIGEVLNNDVNNGDTLFKSKDTIIINTQNRGFDTVSGARVRLIYNGQTFKTFNQDKYFKSTFSANQINLTENESYSLEISAPNYKTITSTQTVPKSVKLQKVTYSQNTYTDPINLGSFKRSELIIEFNDPVGEENYYAIDVDENLKEPDIASNGVVTGYYFAKNTYSIYLNDQKFDGKTYSAHVPLYNEFFSKDTLSVNNIYGFKVLNYFIKFRTVTKDFDKYQDRINQSQNSYRNPFAEPTSNYSNFENGLGLFVLSGKADTLTFIPK